MKACFLTVWISLSAILFAAEKIPAREPRLGEERPAWWWDCWCENIVVIKGKITLNVGVKPNVTVLIDPDAAKGFLDEKDLELHNKWSGKYYFARLKPEEFIFATPGISSGVPFIAELESKNLKEIQVLVPAVNSRDPRDQPIPQAKDGEEGVFILDYKSFVNDVPFVLSGRIEKDDLPSAKEVFDLRKQFDYRKAKLNKAEQAGAGQPANAPQLKAEGKEKPQPEAEGRSR